jgi:hypothetical protein
MNRGCFHITLGLLALLGFAACAATGEVGKFAAEHDLYFHRVCNADLPKVFSHGDIAHKTACLSDDEVFNTGKIQNEEVSKSVQEEAL